MRARILRTRTGVAAIAMLTFAGCSSQTDVMASQTAAGQYAETNFDLDKCLPIQPNLYRCPAIDKPLCTVEFARPDIECVRVGAKGHVFVQKRWMDSKMVNTQFQKHAGRRLLLAAARSGISYGITGDDRTSFIPFEQLRSSSWSSRKEF
jgi:hypothetical protein